MLQDFLDRGIGTEIETDICVIGGGAAGITLALALAGSSRDVLLVESGGMLFDQRTQSLYAGDSVGLPYVDLDAARLRYLGGSTNHWGGHCRPLDPIDFERRPWVPHSGWPIGRRDLDPYYEIAAGICELGPIDINRIDTTEVPGLFDLTGDRIVRRLWAHSPPTRFGERYHDRLVAAGNVQVMLNANVIEIVADDPPNSVRSVSLRTIDGRTGVVRAKIFVLACGGIENARLLLASDGVMAGGLGNAHDLVGRFFADHPHGYAAYAVPLDSLALHAIYYQAGVPLNLPGGPVTVSAKVGLTEEAQRLGELNNCAIDVGYGYDRSTGYLALRETVKALMAGRIPGTLGDAVARLAGDLDGAAAGLYRRVQNESVYWFSSNVEPTPNRDSRVMLGTERDALGMRKSRLDWRLSEQDKRTTRAACRILGEELARAGIARMRLEDWLLEEDNSWDLAETRYHHMGTTRMSDDPRQGVVDRDCRVHGLANLYIAGSSVFPTSGYANPTLTIVALAARLADHLGSGDRPLVVTQSPFGVETVPSR